MRPWYLRPYKVINVAAITADVNSPAIDVLFGTFVNFIAVWSGLTGTGSVQIQTTNDDVHNPNVTPVWLNEGSPLSVTGASGSGVIKISNPGGRYVRAQLLEGTISAGAIEVTVVGRAS